MRAASDAEGVLRPTGNEVRPALTASPGLKALAVPNRARAPCGLRLSDRDPCQFSGKAGPPAQTGSEFPDFLYFELSGKCLPPPVQEPFTGSEPNRAPLRRDPRISQVMPFLCELSPHESWKGIESAGEVCLLGGELALPPPGRKRVSRLIGNFDTTAKCLGWQVTWERKSANETRA